MFALSLFCGAHLGEIVRGALQAIPRGADRRRPQRRPHHRRRSSRSCFCRRRSGRSCRSGSTRPSEIVKASTLLSVIGVGELLLKTQEIVGRTFLTLEFYLFAGLLFFLVNFAHRAARHGWPSAASHSSERHGRRTIRVVRREEEKMTGEFTPKFGLEGKIVLVTGASRGIGRACALACAGAGADVVAGVRDPDGCADLVPRSKRSAGAPLPCGWTSPTLRAVRTGVAQAETPRSAASTYWSTMSASVRKTSAENVTEADFDYTVDDQPQGHVLHHPGGGEADDRAKIRADHQHQLAGRQRRRSRARRSIA